MHRAPSPLTVLALSASAAACAAPSARPPQRAAVAVAAASPSPSAPPAPDFLPVDGEVTVHTGEAQQLHVPGVRSYHLSMADVADIAFHDDDVLIAGKNVGATSLTLIAGDGGARTYRVHVLDFAGTPIDLQVGESKSFRLPHVDSFHVSKEGVANVAFVDDLVTLDGARPGITAVTFVAGGSQLTHYVVRVSAP